MQFLFLSPLPPFQKRKHYIQKIYREEQKWWSKVWNSFYSKNRTGFVSFERRWWGKGEKKLDWMSCWSGDNYWIFSETLKLEVIKRNFRVKESTFLFCFVLIHHIVKLWNSWSQVASSGKSVSRFKAWWGSAGRGAEGASQGLSNPETSHTVTPSSWDNSQVLLMLFYLTPKHLLLARAWVRVLVWRNLALDQIWPLSANGVWLHIQEGLLAYKYAVINLPVVRYRKNEVWNLQAETRLTSLHFSGR